MNYLHDALTVAGNSSGGITTSGAVPILCSDTVWEDLRFPATRVRLGSLSKPDFNYTDITVDFDPTSDETIYVNAQMPHRWKEGSAINPHIHWIQNQNVNIPWKFEYRIQANSAAKTTAWSTKTLDQLSYTYVSGNLNQISYASSMIDMTGYGISCILQMKLTRDVSEDSYSGDAQLYELDIHFQIDTLGSQDEYSK